MSLSRREFIQLMGYAIAASMATGCGRDAGKPSAGDPGKAAKTLAQNPEDIYNIPKFGNVSIMHMTDCHAQLNPIYFREPNVNLGIGSALGQAPHLVGTKLLEHFKVFQEFGAHQVWRLSQSTANTQVYIGFAEVNGI